MIYDRKSKQYIKIKESKILVFFYSNIIGRLILKLFTGKWFSNLIAFYMRSPLSKLRIKRFIKKNKINMDDYVSSKYSCFDEFFIRELKPNKRILSNDESILVSPCDAKLSVYKIDDYTNLNIKNSNYTIKELLQDKDLASKYQDGYCLVFRLCVDDYHHYHYIDSGITKRFKRINGKLHTVRPIAHQHTKVFSENTREYTLLDTHHFGNVIQMEVGALLVGKICNLKKNSFTRGEEKGYFRFGGSTVVLLFEKDKIVIDSDILEQTQKDIEVKVSMFESIGRRF